MSFSIFSMNWHHFEPMYLPPYSPDFNPIERLWLRIYAPHSPLSCAIPSLSLPNAPTNFDPLSGNDFWPLL